MLQKNETLTFSLRKEFLVLDPVLGTIGGKVVTEDVLGAVLLAALVVELDLAALPLALDVGIVGGTKMTLVGLGSFNFAEKGEEGRVNAVRHVVKLRHRGVFQ